MQKAEIRSLVRNSLPKYDKVGRWLDRYVDGAVEKAIASIYEDIWKQSPLSLAKYTKQYGYDTAIPVLTETTTGIKYSTLPESIIPFQDKSSGCRRISTIVQGAFTFFPMDFREMDLIPNGCYFNTINKKIGYAVNQDRIEYYNMLASVETVGVRMDLIIPFSKYEEEDEVKIPEIVEITGTNYQKKSETFMDRVMAILSSVAPVDLADNNATGQTVQRDN
jgi:hypothetical protein